MFDTLSNRRKSVPSFSPLPYSWFPLGQGRNNKMAYSLNLQTPSLPLSVWYFISKQCAYEFFFLKVPAKDWNNVKIFFVCDLHEGV